MVTSRINRRINRAVLDADQLARAARGPPPPRGVRGHASPARRAQAARAFSPFGTQRVERLDDRVFAVRRGAGTADELLCVTNVTGDVVPLQDVSGIDVLTGEQQFDSLVLGPWHTAWVRPD